MIFLSLISVLSFCAGDAPAGPSAPAPSAESDGVIRRYDLEACNLRTSLGGSLELLLPASAESWLDEGGYESGMALDPDGIVELIQTLCGDEFEYEGRYLYHTEGLLVVKAPPRLQAKIGEILSFVEGATHSRTELQIDVIDLAEPLPRPVDTGLVSLAEAERIAALVPSTAPRQSYRVELRPGRTAAVDLTRHHRFLGDYDVEVAQAAFAHDPVVHTMISGTRLEIAGSPVGDALALSVLYRHGTPTGEAEEVDLDQHGFVGSEAGQTFLRGPRLTQRLGMAGRSFACNIVLPEGRALVLRSTLDLAEASGTQLVLVRRAGPSRHAIHRMTSRSDVLDLTLVELGSLAPRRSSFSGILLDRQLRLIDADRLHWYESDPLLAARLEWREDSTQSLIEEAFPDRWSWSSDTWLVSHESPDQDGEGRDVSRDRLDYAALVESLLPEEEVVEVSLALQRRGEGVSKGAECDLVAGVGLTSAVVLGVEATKTIDYDVEIAHSSTVADPITCIRFDGLVLTVTPRRTPTGELSLELRGLANLLRESRAFDPIATLHGRLDQELFDRLLVDEVLTVTEQNGGRFRLGDVGGGESLELMVQVREPNAAD